MTARCVNCGQMIVCWELLGTGGHAVPDSKNWKHLRGYRHCRVEEGGDPNASLSPARFMEMLTLVAEPEFSQQRLI